MSLEDTIPVCNVFEGDEAFWTEKFSGPNSAYVRSAINSSSNMDSTTRRLIAEKKSQTMVKVHASRSPQERVAVSLAISEGHSKGSGESKLLRRARISKGLSGFWSGLSPEERSLKSKVNSEAQIKYWEDLSEDEYRERCLINSRTWSDLSEEDYRLRCSSFSRGDKAYWSSLSLEGYKARGRASSLANKKYWESLTPQEREAKGLVLSKAWASMSESSREARLLAMSRGSKREWALLDRDSYEARRKAFSSFWKNLSEEERSKKVLNLCSGRASGPNTPELFLGLYLERRFPGLWFYNGQGQQGLALGGKIPDFVRIDGSKEVVELFGNYFHPLSDEASRKSHYLNYGYSCFVVWEFDAYLESELDLLFGVTDV